MKIKAKDFVADNKKFPNDQVEKAPIQETEDGVTAPSRTNLEHEYLKNDLGYGDRLRLINDYGQLIDVILMPDGQVAIQQLAVKLDYGPTTVYATWEEADPQAQGYSFDNAIKASKSDALRKLIEKATKIKNPYEK